MSLQVDGVWKGGVWASTPWAAGVWREGAAPAVVVASPPTGGGIVRSRRRYIFPDGTVVMATVHEARQLLAQFVSMREEQESLAKTKTASKTAAPKPAAVAKAPEAELQKIVFKPLADTAGELLSPILPNRLVWMPDPGLLAEAVMRLKRKADDEEAIVALLI